MTGETQKPPRLLNAWVVLGLALVGAISIWFLWAIFGLGLVHKVVSSDPHASLLSRLALMAPRASEGAQVDPAAMLTQLGQSGDAFGSLNTFLTAIAGALVFWAGFMQHRALTHAQAEADREKEARQKQAEDMRTTIVIAERSAKFAEEANLLARESHIADQRAWLKLVASISGPLTFSEDGLTVELSLKMTNFGKTPALQAFSSFELKAPMFGGDSDSWNPRIHFEEIIKDRRSLASRGLGFTIFPGEELEILMKTTMAKDEVERITKDFPAIYLIAFCVTDYRLVQNGAIHLTGSTYEIQRIGIPRPEAIAKNRSLTAVWVDEGDIPVHQLQLVNSFIAPGFAD